MKQLAGSQIRQMFLDYFKNQGHIIEPGVSLVPHNDPTPLWINIRVTASKKCFDGSKKPKNNRITNAQKSICTNDIKNVGETTRHHTSFEMLGNFSIGDYFREEAILLAWEFLTSPKWIGFPKEKLYVSVHTDDADAYRIQTGVCRVDPSYILKTDDNLWEIEGGPGGPSSETFCDRGEAYDPEGLREHLLSEELGNGHYIEIWNVVFSQFDCKSEPDRRGYKELSQKNIDTGMGPERLVTLVQGGGTSFDTDLFLPIIHATEACADARYVDVQHKMAFHVIADRTRTVSFALADGTLFSNEGRGCVLCRVLRRAVRFTKKLDIQRAFMYKLVPVVYDAMKDFYPYIEEKLNYIARLVKAEEKCLHTTLADGERLLLQVMEEKKESRVIDGKTAFKLYNIYGLPLELTVEIAEESGYAVDKDGFGAEMQQQGEHARVTRGGAESMGSQSIDLMEFTQESSFIGYDVCHTSAKVTTPFQDGVKVDAISGERDVVFNTMVFYAGSDGQADDSGIVCVEDVQAIVDAIIKAPHKQYLSRIIIKGDKLRVGDAVELRVDKEKRNVITSNHSCTHLLQGALKQIVGSHIQQAGSFVSEECLRSDFTCLEEVNEEQLKEIERLVNRYISGHCAVSKVEMPIEEAKKSGATVLLDEKYGDTVRVVNMGNVSKEFCSGCHVNNAQEIGVCEIINEENIGSGVRYTTAKTEYDTYTGFVKEDDTLHAVVSDLEPKGISRVEEKIASVLGENVQLKKEFATLQASILALKASDPVNYMQELNRRRVLIEHMDNADVRAMKDIIFNIHSQRESCVVLLVSVHDDKITFVTGVDKAAVSDGIRRGDLAQEVVLVCDGKGGRRPGMVQSDGKDVSKVEEVLHLIRNMLS